jgi:hypothetical protein
MVVVVLGVRGSVDDDDRVLAVLVLVVLVGVTASVAVSQESVGA